MKQSMVDTRTDEKSFRNEKLYNHSLDKRKEIIKNIQFKVEDIFGHIVTKDSISPD